MKRFGRVLCISSLLLFGMVASALAQWGYGPVVVFDQRNGNGTASSFGIGEFRNNRGEFGTLRNDSARSVTIPAGYRARFCEDEGARGEGTGRCEDVAEGNHNLQYGGSASYVRVWGPGGGGFGWNGGGQRGAVVYEDRDSRGRSQDFGVGRYLNMAGAFGNLRNDSASSVVVNRGFRIRLCENEGTEGRGSGRCEDYGEGRYNLRYNDSASYIEVARTGWSGGWGGGTWEGGNPVGNNPGWNGNNDNNNNNRGVIVYVDRNQTGNSQFFDAGTYLNNRGEMSQIGNDTASSVWVAPGYHVQLCENEPRGLLGNAGSGRCEEYGAGRYNLRYNDSASYIRVWRGR